MTGRRLPNTTSLTLCLPLGAFLACNSTMGGDGGGGLGGEESTGGSSASGGRVGTGGRAGTGGTPMNLGGAGGFGGAGPSGGETAAGGHQHAGGSNSEGSGGGASGGAGSGGYASGGTYGSGGGTYGSGGAGSGGAPPVQNCTSFVDRTAEDADRTILWNQDVASDPARCMEILIGQSVTWASNFGTHPLLPTGGDSPGPITTDYPQSGDHTIVFPSAGTFGFICENHTEMRGAIHVTAP